MSIEHGHVRLRPGSWNVLRLQLNVLRFPVVVFSCLHCLPDLTISNPCAWIPHQQHTKCSKGVYWAYMVPHLPFVVSSPVFLYVLCLTQRASIPNFGLWMFLGDEYFRSSQNSVYGHSCESFTQQVPAQGPAVAGTLISWYFFYCAS